MAEVTYQRDVVVTLLRHLNQIVVSLDRLGSSSHEFSREQFEAALARFVVDWDVFGKLAQVRSLLSEPFSTQLGPDDMDEVERAMGGIVYWSSDQPTPSREFGPDALAEADDE
jgi:hypothetical protein